MFKDGTIGTKKKEILKLNLKWDGVEYIVKWMQKLY